MPVNGQPNKGHRYAPGHPFYPRKRLTKRQLRKLWIAKLDEMILKNGDPVNLTRLIHTRMRVEAEL